jgi:hypothetical protein
VQAQGLAHLRDLPEFQAMQAQAKALGCTMEEVAAAWDLV